MKAPAPCSVRQVEAHQSLAFPIPLCLPFPQSHWHGFTQVGEACSVLRTLLPHTRPDHGSFGSRVSVPRFLLGLPSRLFVTQTVIPCRDKAINGHGSVWLDHRGQLHNLACCIVVQKLKLCALPLEGLQGLQGGWEEEEREWVPSVSWC